MPIADSPIVRRLLSEAESRLGVTVQPAREVARLRMVEQEFGEFRQDAEELALHSLDYFEGRPHEMRRERRIRLAQRSRIALLQDPLAGAEAELLANFGFGKGVSRPTARNPKVQDVIDSAWTDPVNEQKLTGYQAQRRLSNELLTSAELFVTLYVGGGKVRVGKIDADRVLTIVTDPEDAQIPLWYVVRDVPPQEWDFDRDAAKLNTGVTAAGQMKVKYWPHWRNVEDAKSDRERLGVEDDEVPLEEPPAEKLAKGLVYHVAINQTGEQLRGNPPWARSLRFFSAMNVLTEAHVVQAQASTMFIARRAMKGSERQITKAASSVLSQASELGAAAFRPQAGWGAGGNAEPPTQPFTGPGAAPPFPPGSWWNEQMDSSKLEAFNLKSNAAEMAQSAQIVRAPIAAASGFGQHYLGDSCHDAATEVLTAEGWLSYRELRERALEGSLPLVAAYDMDAEVLRYEEPSRFWESEFDGEMVAFRGRAQDVLVTPNHRMVVSADHGRGIKLGADNARVLRADEVERGRWAVRVAAPLEGGGDVESFVLPAFRKRYAANAGSFPRREDLHERIRTRRAVGQTWGQISEDEGCSPATISRALGLAADRRSLGVTEPEREVRMDDWLSFLGWWIAEGSASEHGRVTITQALDSPFLERAQRACVNSGFVGTHRERRGDRSRGPSWSWTANSVQLSHWLRTECGEGSQSKRLPAFVFDLSRRQKMILLRALMAGDGQCDPAGRWERSGQSVYGTCSRRLADDVQRLALECGFRALLSDWPTRDGRRPQYRVGIVAAGGSNGRGERDNRCVSLGKPSRVRYRGPVFCLSLPSGTMVTRRNGRVAFHGNSDANLATAATLELPATMRVGAWQEFFEQLFRWFTDRAIEAAVKAGLLGGADGFDGSKPLSEMRLAEAEDRQAMESRTGKDLSYEFSMPFPGRRQLADVTTSVQVVSGTMDPNGVNIPLRRTMLKFFFEQIGIDDVGRAVEECIPQTGMPGGIGPQKATGNAPGAFGGSGGQGGGQGAGGGQTGAGAGSGANDPGEGQQPYGAKSGTASGGGSAGEAGTLEAALEGEWLPAGARSSVDALTGDAAKLFKDLVGDPAMSALALNGAR